jgi:outer membrane protein assembly factor BamE (lipoprotein component of BamABCDE complex)
VLNESDFYELRPGMTKEEVLYRIGHPSDVRYLSRQQHQLWSYRYESPFCVWFQVSVDRAGRVAELGHNTDPACDPPDYF